MIDYLTFIFISFLVLGTKYDLDYKSPNRSGQNFKSGEDMEAFLFLFNFSSEDMEAFLFWLTLYSPLLIDLLDYSFHVIVLQVFSYFFSYSMRNIFSLCGDEIKLYNSLMRTGNNWMTLVIGYKEDDQGVYFTWNIIMLQNLLKLMSLLLSYHVMWIRGIKDKLLQGGINLSVNTFGSVWLIAISI